MIRGIVFDMDGTIFDTEKQYRDGWVSSAKNMGFDLPMELFYKCCGLPHKKLKETYLDYYGKDFDFEKLHQGKIDYQNAEWEKNGIPIKDGFFELMDFCREHNIKTAIATSTVKDRAVRMLKTAGVYECFDSVISGDELERGKPYPDIFEKAAENMGVSCAECIGVEDSTNGIIAVKRAGMTSVFVVDITEPNEKIKENSDYIFKSLSEIINLVKIL